jgi:hypothetical protein
MQPNRVGNVALVLSLLGMASICVFCAEWFLRRLPWALPLGSLFCPVGFLLGLIALWFPPRRTAKWAIAIGLLGSLYVPTIWIFFLRAMSRVALNVVE